MPVSPDTLIRRWYVHRIRLDSEGTTRRVRIGTGAFARSTEWFELEDCENCAMGSMIDSARQSLLVALGEQETIALSRAALACVLPLARCPPHLQEGADCVELEQAVDGDLGCCARRTVAPWLGLDSLTKKRLCGLPAISSGLWATTAHPSTT